VSSADKDTGVEWRLPECHCRWRMVWICCEEMGPLQCTVTAQTGHTFPRKRASPSPHTPPHDPKTCVKIMIEDLFAHSLVCTHLYLKP